MDAIPELLPSNATPAERALDLGAARAASLETDALRAVKRPLRAEAGFLPFLAHEFRVDLWNPDWGEMTRRAVAARAVRDHMRKGTLAGLRRYLEIMDAEIIDHRVPFEGYFAAPDLPKELLDAYIARHPKVRIVLARQTGRWHLLDGFIADHAVVDEASTHIDDGPSLYGRKAVLRQDGVETALRTATLVDTQPCRNRGGVTIERVSIAGTGVAFSHADEFASNDSFADACDDPPRTYTYALPRDYMHDRSRLEVTRVPVGFQPRDMRYRRESTKSRDSAPTIFAGDFAGEGFAGLNDAVFLIADVIHLIDPTIPSPVINSGSFADFNRVGFAAHTAELQVDWRLRAPLRSALFAGDSFVGDDPVLAADSLRRDALLGAITASSRLSDKLLVSFQLQRPRLLGDGIRLDQTTRLDAAVANIL